MKYTTLIKRKAAAKKNADAAMKTIAQALGIEPTPLGGVSSRVKSHDLNELLQIEAISAFLVEASKALGDAQPASDLDAILDEITQIDGIGAATAKKIRAHFTKDS